MMGLEREIAALLTRDIGLAEIADDLAHRGGAPGLVAHVAGIPGAPPMSAARRWTSGRAQVDDAARSCTRQQLGNRLAVHRAARRASTMIAVLPSSGIGLTAMKRSLTSERSGKAALARPLPGSILPDAGVDQRHQRVDRLRRDHA